MAVDAKARVFISYAHKDNDFVERLVGELKLHNLDVWFDKQEIIVGETWVERLSEGLQNSDYFVVVLSRASLSSPYVKAELNAALGRKISGKGTTVLPVLLEDVDVPPLIQNLAFADFRAGFEAGITQLLPGFKRPTPPRPAPSPFEELRWGFKKLLRWLRVVHAVPLLVVLIGMLAVWLSDVHTRLGLAWISDRWSYNFPFLFRLHQDINEIVIIEVNEADRRRFGVVEDAPIARTNWTRLLAKLGPSLRKPRVIVFDMYFTRPSRNPSHDQEFASAIQGLSNVVLGAKIQHGRLDPPVDPLARAARAWGIVNVVDPELVRRLQIRWAGREETGLAWQAALILREELKGTEGQERWLNYYGAQTAEKSLFRTFCLTEVMEKLESEPSLLHNKILFIGNLEDADLRDNPCGGDKISGVKIQATEYANLVRGDWLRRIPVSTQLLMMVAWGVIVVGLTATRTSIWSCGASLLAAVVFLVIVSAFVQLRLQHWWPWPIPMAVAILALLFKSALALWKKSVNA